MIDKWYDCCTRSWVIQVRNDGGYQVGRTIRVATIEEADKEAEKLAKVEKQYTQAYGVRHG